MSVKSSTIGCFEGMATTLNTRSNGFSVDHGKAIQRRRKLLADPRLRANSQFFQSVMVAQNVWMDGGTLAAATNEVSSGVKLLRQGWTEIWADQVEALRRRQRGSLYTSTELLELLYIVVRFDLDFAKNMARDFAELCEAEADLGMGYVVVLRNANWLLGRDLPTTRGLSERDRDAFAFDLVATALMKAPCPNSDFVLRRAITLRSARFLGGWMLDGAEERGPIDHAMLGVLGLYPQFRFADFQQDLRKYSGIESEMVTPIDRDAA